MFPNGSRISLSRSLETEFRHDTARRSATSGGNRPIFLVMSNVAEARRFYAQLLAARAGAADPRIEEAFAAVPREDFLGRGPWKIVVTPWLNTPGSATVTTPSADPSHIYRNALVALDADKGINNGEPLLHVMWMAKIAARPGDAVCHIGAGAGYYSALLSLLVSPGGAVTAFEIEPGLAARGARNLAPYPNVKLVHGDAVTLDLPPSDVIYVNAGVAAPPLSWLKALKPGGRLIFPWRPADRVGLAVLVTCSDAGFVCDAFMSAWFIPCVGASTTEGALLLPTRKTAATVRSLWSRTQRDPDDSAVAIFDDIWFSSTDLL
jgi:protein-L-isoaspartate(D-aspartate) O-methyltransferase